MVDLEKIRIECNRLRLQYLAKYDIWPFVNENIPLYYTIDDFITNVNENQQWFDWDNLFSNYKLSEEFIIFMLDKHNLNLRLNATMIIYLKKINISNLKIAHQNLNYCMENILFRC